MKRIGKSNPPGLKNVQAIQPTLSAITIAAAAAASTARLLFQQSRVVAQSTLWSSHLPEVTPYYAVKANNDPTLLRWLRGTGARFDCASPREMEDVRAIGAAPSTDIVYAQPCKTVTDLRRAASMGVRTTVVDSVEEVEKLAAAAWPGDTLIRLLVPDAASAQPFSRKFGAPPEWVPAIQRALHQARIPHSGWSFHVGSVCQNPAQFARAIECAAAVDSTRSNPAARRIVDLGGGFVSDPASFAAAAAAIRTAMPLFPAATTTWIAEPGRFFAAPAADAEVEVIGVKPRLPPATSGTRVTLDESVYGIFSNIPFDGYRPVFEHLDPAARHRPVEATTVFGRTCDSADCIAEDIQLPALRVGDRLRVRNMGAYTVVSSSEFNGFPAPLRKYVELA